MGLGVVAGRLGSTFRILASFLSGQVALQALQFAAGLVIIRGWPIEAYAGWAVLVATQATLAALIDLGARDGVLALNRGGSGEGFALPQLMAQALRLRTRHLLLLAPAVILYLLWLSRSGIIPTDQLGAAILLTLATAWANGWIAYYGLPLLLARDMRGYYAPQLGVAAARLLLLAILFATGQASLTLLLIVSFANSAAIGLYFRRRCGPISSDAEADGGARRALSAYSYSIAPATIYNSFQEQISIFLLSSIGNARAISETAAIGRLALLFQLLLAMNAVLIQPWIARAGSDVLLMRVVGFATAACSVAATVVLAIWLYPAVPLYILGASYAHADREVLLAAIAASTLYAANAFWCVNVARGWIWRWTGTAYAILIGVAQVSAIVALGIRDAEDAFHVSIVMAMMVFTFHLAHTLAGLVQPRALQHG